MRWRDLFVKPQATNIFAQEEIARTLRDFQVQLSRMEDNVNRQALEIRGMRDREHNSAYLGEVSNLMAALGPAAFKGVVKTCFSLPEETMRVKGESSQMRDSLENATAALDRSQLSIVELSKQNLELSRKLMELEREVVHKLTVGKPNGDARKQLS